jgi:hypothetical protein
VSAATRDASVCVEPIFDADRIKGHHLSESNPKCRSSQFGSINGRRIVPSILHCLLSRQILSREQGTACLARLQNNRLPIALKPFPHRVFGVYDRTFDNWTCYHNIIYSLSFFIRFNCVSESPSHGRSLSSRPRGYAERLKRDISSQLPMSYQFSFAVVEPSHHRGVSQKGDGQLRAAPRGLWSS